MYQTLVEGPVSVDSLGDDESQSASPKTRSYKALIVVASGLAATLAVLALVGPSSVQDVALTALKYEEVPAEAKSVVTVGEVPVEAKSIPTGSVVANSKCKASVAETWTVSSSGDSITRPDGSSYTVDLVDLGQGYYAAERTSDGKCLIVGGNCRDSFFHWYKWTSDGSTCGLENYKGKGFMLSNGQAALKLTQV
jgi:hypothetical protein